MESEEISEIPSTKLETNKNDVNDHASASVPGALVHGNPDLASVPLDRNRETGESSIGKGNIQNQDPAAAGGGEELPVGGGGNGGEEEGDSDLEDEDGGESEDDEVEYDDEDMFFDQQFEPDPHSLHRINSMKEPMGEEGGREGRVHGKIVHDVPYCLKISRLKIFVDFVGRSMATKILSREISNS